MDKNIRNIKMEINPKRFQYILDLYGLSYEKFLYLINEERKRDLLSNDDLNKIIHQEKKVDVSLLKRIDKIFNQGLTWYITKRDIPDVKNSSIFFRKNTFNSGLNLESRKVIKNFEELKYEISILCKKIKLEPKKQIKKYDIKENPNIVGEEIRNKFDEIENDLIIKKYIKKPYKNDRIYLENLIRIMEKLNIFVFELIDRKRKPEKEIIFNGFYMTPNVIVIKRQKYFRREIFTLLHELAHYLLDFEEVDENVEINNITPNNVESWCNNFAFSFLIKEYKETFNNLGYASINNNFYKNEITDLYEKTRLSDLALYTRLRINKKISQENYDKIKNAIISSVRKKEEQVRMRNEERKRLLEKQGKKFSMGGPKEIKSNLFEEIVMLNYFSGNINENRLREHLKIKPDVSIEEVIY